MVQFDATRRTLPALDMGLAGSRDAPFGSAGHSSGTAGDKPEEGGDDVKSSWPLCPGLHTCYNDLYRGLRYRKVEPIPKVGLSSD